LLGGGKKDERRNMTAKRAQGEKSPILSCQEEAPEPGYDETKVKNFSSGALKIEMPQKKKG